MFCNVFTSIQDTMGPSGRTTNRDEGTTSATVAGNAGRNKHYTFGYGVPKTQLICFRVLQKRDFILKVQGFACPFYNLTSSVKDRNFSVSKLQNLQRH